MFFKAALPIIFFIFSCITATELPVHIKPNRTNWHTTTHELPLVVLICSYNNAPWVIENLDSVRMQDYTNWRIVYFDDASTDGTPDRVLAYLEQNNLVDKCTLIANQHRGRKLKNLYTAFHHFIDDQEIIVQLDGDDWLAHEHVFSTINTIYQEHDVWMTYGNYQNVPVTSRMHLVMACMPHELVEQRAFRSQMMFMHLRTFYGWLAKQIKIENLLNAQVPGYCGKYYPASNDAATMWPMFEMAWHHFAFIEENLYYLNRTNPINGFKVDKKLQRKSTRELQEKIPLYGAIETPILNRLAPYHHAQADCIIISHNNPDAIQELVRSLDTQTTGLHEIWVFYQADTPELEAAYRHIFLDNINCVHNFSVTGSSINQNFCELLTKLQAEHVLICNDTIELIDQIDIHSCILELERTGAYGFYLSIGHDQRNAPDQHVWDDLYACKFNVSKYAWFNTLDMTLMRKKDMQDRITHLNQKTTIAEFITCWGKDLSIDLTTCGLYYESAKITGPIHSTKTALPPLPLLPKRRILHNPSKENKNPETADSRTKKRERRVKKQQLLQGMNA